jgi:hypothetical protein
MRLQARSLIVSCCAVTTFASAQAAGTVDVSFVDPARFSDAGASDWEERANLGKLSEHLRQLGQQHLKSGQVLKIDVLDVDLAGEMRPSRRIADLRISKGMADWPKISVRYVLQADGQASRSGEEIIGDMSYQQRGADHQRFEPLRREKQMLERWFKTRFGE